MNNEKPNLSNVVSTNSVPTGLISISDDQISPHPESKTFMHKVGMLAWDAAKGGSLGMPAGFGIAAMCGVTGGVATFAIAGIAAAVAAVAKMGLTIKDDFKSSEPPTERQVNLAKMSRGFPGNLFSGR